MQNGKNPIVEHFERCFYSCLKWIQLIMNSGASAFKIFSTNVGWKLCNLVVNDTSPVNDVNKRLLQNIFCTTRDRYSSIIVAIAFGLSMLFSSCPFPFTLLLLRLKSHAGSKIFDVAAQKSLSLLFVKFSFFLPNNQLNFLRYKRIYIRTCLLPSLQNSWGDLKQPAKLYVGAMYFRFSLARNETRNQSALVITIFWAI